MSTAPQKTAKPVDELHNASQFPKLFYCRHMQPGTVKYNNEMVLVDTDAIKKMMPSGVGKPVYINHQKVELDTMKEKACGYITDSFYNEVDGWCWFKFIAIDDDAITAIMQNWAVSNAYIPSARAAAGTKNNVPYDSEILDGNFTHLAIVPDPRYEGACIMSPEKFREYQDTKKRELEELHNSKTPQKGTAMSFKFFKNEKKEVSTIDAECSVELENGKVVTVGEMINAMKKNSDDEEAAKKAKSEKENKNADEQTVEVAGEVMPLKELINRFTKLNEKKNAEDEEEAKKLKAEKEKENAEDEDKKKKDADEAKENAKYVDELKNASNKAGAIETITIDTSANKLARGKDRY